MGLFGQKVGLLGGWLGGWMGVVVVVVGAGLVSINAKPF